jgi:hypothetical protein
LILSACPLLLAVGCGGSRTHLSTITEPAPPDRASALTFPAAGLRLRAPRTWRVLSESPPLVTVVASGAAVVAAWRFPRRKPLPASARELSRARSQLLRDVRARPDTIQVLGASITRLAGSHAIVLEAIERIGGAVRRIRSVHVYAYRAEFVVDEYAPIELFESLDRMVFSPLLGSLTLSPAR